MPLQAYDSLCVLNTHSQSFYVVLNQGSAETKKCWYSFSQMSRHIINPIVPAGGVKESDADRLQYMKRYKINRYKICIYFVLL